MANPSGDSGLGGQQIGLLSPPTNFQLRSSAHRHPKSKNAMDKGGPPAKERPGPTRRRRPALACEACRARKIKCDRNTPCNKCIRGKRARTCTYVPDGATPVPRASSDRLPTPLSADGLATQATQQPPAESASVKAAPVELLPTSQPNEQSNLPTKATRDKGKLFGASHWTNPVEHVSGLSQL